MLKTIPTTEQGITEKLLEYRLYPYSFMVDMLQTLDEVRRELRDFPEKNYLHRLIEVFQQEQKILIPKSRRIMATWATAAWVLWNLIFIPMTEAYWQSKNRDEADFVLQKRLYTMYRGIKENHPWFPLPKIHTNALGMPTQYEFKLIHDIDRNISSVCNAVAEGADQARGKTASIYVLDEFAFQKRQDDTLATAVPCTEGGGQLIVISSIKAGTVYELLVHDKL